MVDVMTTLDNPEQILGNLQQSASNIGQGIYVFFFIFLSIALLASLIIFVFWYKSFKFKIKIKEVISADGHFIIYEDFAKRKKISGAEFWKLRRRKAVISAPPREALQVTSRGVYYAECIHHEKSGLDAGYEWIISNPDLVRGDYKISSTQEERALLADRIRRAEERKGRSLLDVIMQFAGMTFVAIIIIALLAFYGEIAGSVNDAMTEVGIVAQHQQEMMKQQVEFQKQLNTILKGLNCQVPSTPVDVPLDQQIGVG